MLTRRIIPCLDIDNGRVVKGVRFSSMRDMGDPAQRAALYESQGADEIVLLDISAATSGRALAGGVISACRARLSIPLTVGGGISSLDAAATALDHGADRVSLNSAAVARPALIDEVVARFGTQAIVVAIDARATSAGRWTVLTRSGRRDAAIDAVEWSKAVARRGAGEVLLTSWDRDGTRDGYDLELVSAISAAVPVPVVASGGAATIRHLHEAFRAGADAVLAASIFHDDDLGVGDIKRELARMGVEVRR